VIRKYDEFGIVVFFIIVKEKERRGCDEKF
jgi:hypothetical protein